jgi:malate/lactate dehydrogenase
VRQKIAVIGNTDLSKILAERDYAEVVEVDAGEDLSGAGIVVLTEPAEQLFEDIRDRAPAAVVIVTGDSPQPVCEATLFPRSRIVGISEPAELPEVVDSIVLDRRREFTCVVRCQGERGIDDDFVEVPVVLGAGGVHEIREDA